MTLQDYTLILEKQNHKCAICGTDETFYDKNGLKSSLAVDHCHETGKLRGLLCHRCNTGIGSLRDSIDLLLKAIMYLEKYL